MQLLITAATAAEIQPTVDWLAKKGSSNLPFSAEVLITGVTAAATTYWLMKRIAQNKPSLIIQAGIAGAFTNCKHGDVFVVHEDTFADCGAWENDEFNSIFDIGVADPNKPPYTNRFLASPYQHLLSFSGLKPVRSITVNEITTRETAINWYNKNYSPVLESMEGAALHYVCLMEKIPFLQLRAVSNQAGERDKTKWNIPLAIENLNNRLTGLLNKLSSDEADFRI